MNQDTGQSLEHKQLRRHPKHKATWDTSYANELGGLCQGIGKHTEHPHKKQVEGTNTFKPIQYHDIPNQRKSNIIYTRVVCELCPQKADPFPMPITLGGDRIHYPGDCGTKTGSLETVKLLHNSVLSTPTAWFASFDISNFYRGTPLDKLEYARIKLTDIPKEFIQEYGLHDFVHNSYIYFEVSMASNRPKNWPMTCSLNAWKCMGTTNAPQPLVFGAINRGQSCLSSLLMTLASNTSNPDMQNTSRMPSKGIIQSPLTGRAPNCRH
eukprot:CCRYP_016440-RA/>CCRYP_016440-RA protein AED:0.38 eAED:0.38 QI:0/0/0/1/0/0/2/0/266